MQLIALAKNSFRTNFWW